MKPIRALSLALVCAVLLTISAAFFPAGAQYTPPNGGGGGGGTCAGLFGDVTGTCGANNISNFSQSVTVATGQDLGTAAHPLHNWVWNGQGVYGVGYFTNTGTPTAQRAIAWRDLGGTVAFTSDIPNTQIATHFDGGGSAITGTKVSCQRIPYGGTITGWYIDSDVSGSATFGARKVAFASYTGVAGYAGYTDVTGGGTAPTISSNTNNNSSTLTSWVTAVSQGQIYCFQVSSVTSSTVLDVYLEVTHP